MAPEQYQILHVCGAMLSISEIYCRHFCHFIAVVNHHEGKKKGSLWQQLGKSCDYVSNARKQMGLDALEWLIVLGAWGWKREWKQRWVFLFFCLHLKWHNLLSGIVFY